jgi:hypothetical protein
MKKTLNASKMRTIGFAVLAAAIAFTFVSCGGGGGGGTRGDGPKSGTFISWDGDTKYTLKISEASGKAVYNPKNGDTYELTIEDGVTITKSNGQVITSSKGELTLRPNGSSGTFKIETSGETITAIPNPIIIDDKGTTVPPPANLAPELGAAPISGNLIVFRFDTGPDGNAAETWQTGFNLSDLTKVKLKEDDVLNFTVSGKSTIPLENMSIELHETTPEAYIDWLGGDWGKNLNGNFNTTFQVQIRVTPDPKNDVIVILSKSIYYRDNDGVETGSTTNDETGKVMATIRDLEFTVTIN